MIDEVVIEASNSAAKLVFLHPERVNGKTEYFQVNFQDTGLKASARVYVHRPELLVSLFEEMVEEWKGWNEPKTYATVEEEFVLKCSSDSFGHAFIDLQLASGPFDEDWKIQTQIRLDAGQYEQITGNLRRFLLARRKAT